MRITNKLFFLFAAFMMITAAFFMPITAYASEETDGETNEPIVISDLSDEGETLENADIIGIEDITDAETETDIDELPEDTKPFTPDGHATVVDLTYEGDGKMFYTFKTPAGNVFYLIVDRERGADNVYFLNAVTEADLLALAENADGTGTNGASTSAIPTAEPSTGESNQNEQTDKTDTPTAGEDDPPTEKKSNTGMIIFAVIGIAAVGGVAYYMKIVRPKQQGGMDDEDDDIPDDGGAEMEFEDEPEEAETDDEDGGEYEDSSNSDGDNENNDGEDRE